MNNQIFGDFNVIKTGSANGKVCWYLQHSYISLYSILIINTDGSTDLVSPGHVTHFSRHETRLMLKSPTR
jgi:hypothetical protein